jgi:HEAT repeat protein
MRNDESSVTRFKVVLGLEKMKSDESTRLLREMLNDNDQWVREKAQKILDKREQK